MAHADVTDNGDGTYAAQLTATRSGTYGTRVVLATKGGLRAAYFANAGWAGAAAATRIDGAVSFAWGGGAAAEGLPTDDFSVRWAGLVRPAFGEVYTWYVEALGEATLWLDREVLLRAAPPRRGGWVRVMGEALRAGALYEVRIDYREGRGAGGLRVLWSSASTPKQAPPRDSQLTLVPAVTLAPRVTAPRQAPCEVAATLSAAWPGLPDAAKPCLAL